MPNKRQTLKFSSKARAFVFTLVFGTALSIVPPPTSFAQSQTTQALTVDATSEIAAALYAASATQEAFARSADARFRQMRSEIEALKLRVLAGEEASRTLADKEREFVDALADRDRAYAQEISVFRDAIEDIASTPEGLNALAMFNDGDELGAIAILDDLRSARDEARQRRADIESASEARRIAVLAVEARSLGKLTTEDVIARYVEMTELDPDVFSDWQALSDLYQSAGNMDRTIEVLDEAIKVADNDIQKAEVLSAHAEVLTLKSEWDRALRYSSMAFGMIERESERDPASDELKLRLAQEHLRHGFRLANSGKTSSAFEHYGDSLVLLSQLIEQADDEGVLLQEVIETHKRIGDLYFRMGLFEDADIAYSNGLSVARELMNKEVDNFDYKYGYFSLLSRLAEIHSSTGNKAKAEATYLEGSEIMREMLLIDKTNARWRRDYLAVLYALITDFSRLDLIEEASSIALELATNDATNPSAQDHLAIMYRLQGNLFVESGEKERASVYFDKALSIWTKIAVDNPDVELHRYRLGQESYRATQLTGDSRYIEAAEKTFEELSVADN